MVLTIFNLRYFDHSTPSADYLRLAVGAHDFN